jgi:hypothetical protein
MHIYFNPTIGSKRFSGLISLSTLRTGRSAKVKEKKAGGKMNYGAVNRDLTLAG